MSASGKLLRGISIRLRSYDWSKWKWANLDKTKIGWAFRSMFHPYSTFSEFKYTKKGSVPLAILFFFLVFLTDTIAYTATGFLFNTNKPNDFNVFYQFLQSDLILVMWCIANWCMTTLMDGEGKFPEIWVVTNYAMLPRIVFSLPLLLLSNLITSEEGVFFVFAQFGVIVWSLILLFVGMMVVHQYSFGKTVASSLLTVACIAFMIFLALLFVSIFQQMTIFFQTIFRELTNIT